MPHVKADSDGTDHDGSEPNAENADFKSWQSLLGLFAFLSELLEILTDYALLHTSPNV